MDKLLEVRQIHKVYRRGRHGTTEALHQVSFTLEQGRCLGIAGESGCGKSTLCRMVTGLERPTSGQVLYRGLPVSSRENRGRIQMVFQNSLDAVNLHMDAFHIISEPLVNFFRMGRRERLAEVGRLMELVGLPPEDMWKYPQQFSGGQLQRICIARALAAKPELLLLDEPLSSLDVSVQAQILNLLADIKASMGLTYLLISHDLEAVYYLSDALMVMYAGSVVERLDRIEDFDALCHPYTNRLLAARSPQKDQILSIARTQDLPQGCPYAPRCAHARELCRSRRPVPEERFPGHWIACHQKS